MPLVSLKPGTPPVDVEFPEGALHLYPGTYRAVTNEQLEILRKDVTLADQLLVLDTATSTATPPTPVIIPDAPAEAVKETVAEAPADAPKDKQRPKRHG